MDWAEHFKKVSRISGDNRRKGEVVEFGTILGNHTAHELNDLLTAKIVNIQDLSNAYNGVADQIIATDPTWNQWISDYSSFMTDWAAAYPTALNTVTLAQNSLLYPLGWDYVNAESDWQAILKVFDPTGTNHSRFADLWARWGSLPNNPDPTPVVRPTPQPTANDSDLNAYQAVDQTIKDLGLPPSLPKLPNPFQVPVWVYGVGLGVLGFVVVYPILSPILFPIAAARHLLRDQ